MRRPFVSSLSVVGTFALLAACSSRVIDLGGSTCEPLPGVRTLAADQAPVGLALDETYAYWIESSPQPPGEGGLPPAWIMKAPLAGGAPTTLAPAVADNLYDIQVDSTDVYWVDWVGVERVPKDGGMVSTVVAATVLANQFWMEVDSTNVYWTIGDGNAGLLMKQDKSGGAPVTLAVEPSSWIGSVAIDASHAYYAVGPTGTLNGVRQGPPGSVVSVPLAGGTPHTLLTTGFDVVIGAMVSDGQDLYYGTLAYPASPSIDPATTLMKTPVGGGAAASLAYEPTGIGSMVLDGANLYWSAPPAAGTPDGASVLRSMPLGGGAITTITECAYIGQLAVNDADLCWYDEARDLSSNGDVVCLSPK